MKRVFLVPRITALFLSLALALPAPTFALRPIETGEQKSGLEELHHALTGRADAVKDISAAGLEEVPEWVSDGLWQEFAKYNLGKPPQIVQASGGPDTVLQRVESALSQVPREVPVEGIPFVQHKPLVALALKVDYPDRTDHILVIDEADYLRRGRMLEEIVRGKIETEEYEFSVHLSVYPREKALHLHNISIGRRLTSKLREQGFGSTTFQKIADKLRRDFPGMRISAVAASAKVEHWFKEHFQAHLASDEEYTQVHRYVSIPSRDRPSLFIGQVIPADQPAASAEVVSTTAGLEETVMAPQEEITADFFARHADPNSKQMIVLGPTAFEQVSGLEEAVHQLKQTSLGKRMIVLPSGLPEAELDRELTAILLEIPQDSEWMAYADKGDPVVGLFAERLRHWKISLPYGQMGALHRLVREILLNAGVLERIATDKAVADWISSWAGLEEAA